MTGSIIGHYEVGEKLGSGGMGVVYRGVDTKLRRPVALKFLPSAMTTSPLARARFLREAQAASALDHPNNATIFEIGEHEGRLFIAMGLYEGETLGDHMRRGPLPIEECESIIRQLLEAAGAAHSAGVIHRDLKPANVLLTRPPTSHSGVTAPIQIKVVDFGLAKLRPEQGDESATRLTEQGALMGTVAYMSPEQARGGTVDSRTDLWSIGVIAYEMLAGKHPFEAPSSVGTLTRIATEEPPELSGLRTGVPEHLERLVPALMHKDLAERPASAEISLAILAGSATAQALRYRASREGRKSRTWLVAALLVVVAGLAIAAGAWLPGWFKGGPASTPSSFVVLPCQVFGAEEVQYLTDAVPSNLASMLAQVEGIDTRRPPTSVEVDPKRLDIRKLAEMFGVDACVTCTITVEGVKDLALTVNLVEPRSSRYLWSGNYRGNLDTFIELTRRSADGIRGILQPGAVGELPSGAVASGSRAELAFQRGKYHSERYNDTGETRDLELASAAFEQALQLDPQLADAAGELAVLRMWSIPSREERNRIARDQAERALAIDDTSSRAWTTLAFIEWDGANPAKALEYALKALRHGPNDGLAYYVVHSQLKLYSDQLALDVIRRSTEIDPLYVWGHVGEANTLFQLGRTGEAIARLDQALEIQPDSYAANMYRCIFLATAGRLDEARAVLEALRDHDPKSSDWYLRPFAQFALDLAGSDEATAAAALQQFPRERCRDFYCLDEAYRNLTPLLLRHGQREFAITLLEEYAAGHGLMPTYDWVMRPELEPLRTHPRFAPLETGARRQYREFRERIEQLRTRGDLPGFLERSLADLDAKLAG